MLEIDVIFKPEFKTKHKPITKRRRAKGRAEG